ncbi:MAG TPA: ABC transporter ATP-binding protein/permease [Candidatus Anaerofilum faecale]|nr:ABC transporter ATP-binding protein/permease [Candidatus Anaerofilum faecale]
MKKLSHYLRPFAGVLAAAFLLLLCQAMLDLKLPDLMSSIVNTGIQQGGIEESAPRAVDPDSLAMLLSMMPEEDAAFVQGQYQPASSLSEEDRVRFDQEWPNGTDSTMVRIDADAETTAALNTAMGRAEYAVVQLLSGLSDGQQSEGSPAVSGAAEMDGQALAHMLAMMPAQARQDAIDTAAVTPDSITSQTGAIFVKQFYQQLGADTDAIQTRYILRTGGLMLLASLGLAVCAIAVGFCASRTGAGVARAIRSDVFRKVTGFTNAEFDRFSTASLITRSTNDITQVQMLITMGLRIVCYAPIIGIGGTVMALRKSTSMAWVLALAVVLILGVILVMLGVALPRFKKMQSLIDRLNLVSRENLSGIMVIRAFATQKFEEDRFDKANRDLTANNLFVYRVMGMLMPTMMLVMNGISVLIIWVGGHQIAESAMQVGDMMAFIQYSMQIIMSFLMISIMFVMIPRAAVSADRIAELLDSESAVQDPEKPVYFPGGRARGVVQFHNVSFAYGGADENVLQNISFTACPGQTTAFIGSTGSGKSTLVNLIPRFYDVTEGSITIDGIDLRRLSQHQLRENIGYVPQKGILLSGDIRSNLAYGVEEAGDDELSAAADIAQATEFISRLPNGMDTSIAQGGTNVSGGQRQRLSIARALVKKAPIYIFDDSFSALDFKTDAKLRAALKETTSDATVLIVAQRVSTIMHAEQIVVLDEGRIVGIGTHRQLLDSCPQYREIAESQLSKEELA